MAAIGPVSDSASVGLITQRVYDVPTPLKGTAVRKFAAILGFLLTTCALAQQERFTVVIDPESHTEPFTGRIYVVFGDENAEPMSRLNAWFNPPPAVAWDVVDAKPGDTIVLDGFDISHAPAELGDSWRSGEWTLQAVARVNKDMPRPGEGAGDIYSSPVTVNLDDIGEGSSIADFSLDQIVGSREFESTESTFLFTTESKLLSDFHDRSVELRASVTVPDSWHDNQDQVYPIVYYITGFGGNENEVKRYIQGIPHKDLIGDSIIVGLDATNYWGHSVFADSAVTGPWGEALTTELIPQLEDRYRGPESAEHRYVTGISSGGWGSLWVQVEYPDVFAGTWSHVPDPVDFRAFQTVDITADDANMYTDETGARRPLGRNGDQVMFWAEDFIAREQLLGPGGQIRSFEAVFSPALEDGSPARLFDVETGKIDPNIAEAWQKYDIRLKLEMELTETGDDLAGKLHVFGGSMDNFYLGEAVGLLKESLDGIGFDAQIEVIEGMPHTFHWEGDKEMWETIHKRWDEYGKK
jgi:S-formylglutathione hydrolase FrmB